MRKPIVVLLAILGALGVLVAACWYGQRVQPGEKATFRGEFGESAHAVAFSPDGKTLAAAMTRTIKLWEVNSGKLHLTLREHGRGINSLSFSPDGQSIASGSFDRTVKVWDVASGEERLTLRSPVGVIWCVAFSPDGDKLAAACGGLSGRNELGRIVVSELGRVVLWDPGTGKERASFAAHRKFVRSLAFSPCGKFLATGGSSDGHVNVWSVDSLRLKLTLKGQQGGFLVVTFSPDGSYLAAIRESGQPPNSRTVLLWNPLTGDRRAELTATGERTTALAFSADSKTLAVGSSFLGIKGKGRFGPIDLWDLRPQAPQFRKRFQAKHGWVTCLAFSPDSKLLAAGYLDGTVMLWDPTEE